MVYYFSSEYLAAVKLNGAYLGLIDNSVTSIKIENENTFLEICPINSNEHALNFILDYAFLSNPPSFACVTDLKGGYVIKFLKSYTGGEFKVLSQEKYDDLIATVYNENGIKISLETKNDFIIEPVPTDCDTVNLFRPELNKNLIAFAFYGKQTLLIVFNIDTKIEKVFFGLVDDFSFEKGLQTTENFLDIAKHSLVINWEFNGESFVEKERSLNKAENFNYLNLTERLLPYAFLEEFMLKGEFKVYLADNIVKNADNLFGFFGEYLGVMPPPLFRNFNEIGLIYRKTQNVYFVDYFSFQLENGKITSIKKCD